jgi:hypothetical protein
MWQYGSVYFEIYFRSAAPRPPQPIAIVQVAKGWDLMVTAKCLNTWEPQRGALRQMLCI